MITGIYMRVDASDEVTEDGDHGAACVVVKCQTDEGLWRLLSDQSSFPPAELRQAGGSHLTRLCEALNGRDLNAGDEMVYMLAAEDLRGVFDRADQWLLDLFQLCAAIAMLRANCREAIKLSKEFSELRAAFPEDSWLQKWSLDAIPIKHEGAMQEFIGRCREREHASLQSIRHFLHSLVERGVVGRCLGGGSGDE